VRRELEQGGYDVVHAITARMALYLPPASPAVHRHFDLIDALSVNMATRAAAEHGPKRALFRVESALLRRFEAAMVAAADSSSLVAGADRDAAPGLERAVVIPMGVDLDRFRFSPPVNRPPTLLFFGNLGYFHNVEPARFLAHEVIPLVLRELPDARLRIAGARPTKAVLALADLPGVDVAGPVDDMVAELHQAAVAILPIFTGSGIKMKVLESFAAGTPVVTNRRGVDGVAGAEAGTHYLAAESASDLAAAAVTLLRDHDSATSLAMAGRALIESLYTWAAQIERLLALFGTR
jgi:glycosyltransferase involved in cell wall biosynthesis